MQLLHILQLLVLMTLANGTPIVAKKIFDPRFSFPLDAGTIFFDGRPLFGSSKTIRGILISVLITTASAPLIGLDLTIGAIVAGAAMAGDLFSGFAKRRLNFPPSLPRSGARIPISDAGMPQCTFIDDRRHRAWRGGLFYRRANSVPPSIPGPRAR
jgi:CDP-2,3-bis-(O-geranylgeranyl)-sn-glycerol synthase